jgi:hypothetical protein
MQRRHVHVGNTHKNHKEKTQDDKQNKEKGESDVRGRGVQTDRL